MRKIFLNILTVTVIFSVCSCISTKDAAEDGLSLLDAIEQTAEKIAAEIPFGTRVAVVAYESENDKVSDFIMDEFTGALRDQKLEVADRRALEYVIREQNFQMSGNVSDETSVSVGKFVGAQMIIIGQFRYLGDQYRITTNAIHVETATHAVVPRFNVRNDRTTQTMLTALANQETSVRTATYGVASLQTQPQTAGTFFDRGVLYAIEDNLERAVADFDEAIKLDPGFDGAQVTRIRVQSGAITNAQIMQAYGDALAREAAMRAENSFKSGMANMERRKFNQAINDFTSALSVRTQYIVAIYYNRGNAYFSRNRRGDIDLAITDLETALRIDPNNIQARDLLRKARQKRGW